MCESAAVKYERCCIMHSVCPSVCLSVHPSVPLSVCLYLCMFVCLSIFVCLVKELNMFIHLMFSVYFVISDAVIRRLSTPPTTKTHFDSPGVATATPDLHWWLCRHLSASVIGRWSVQCCIGLCEWSVSVQLRPHCCSSTNQRRRLVIKHRLFVNTVNHVIFTCMKFLWISQNRIKARNN